MTEHPPLTDLLERTTDPGIADHLADCAPCRALTKMLSGLDEVEGEALPEIEFARGELGEVLQRTSLSLSASAGMFGTIEPPQIRVGRRIGAYVVEDHLGSGGMGTVYRVRHEGLATAYALKVLHRAGTLRERLRREGQVQGQLRHPHIVSVTNLIEVDGDPGLVMELVDGPTLRELLVAGPLPEEVADRLGQQIIRAVAAAHRAGLVHRDLKPGNVLLASTDEGLHAKVTDFGLAKLLHEEDALGSRALGTPAYMSPEQIRNAGAADARSDVFSLGALLFELVTGERAFRGADQAELFDKIRAGDHPPLPAGVPDRMRAAIEGALDPDPERRIPDAESLLRTWRGTRSDAPVLGAPNVLPWAIAAGAVLLAVLVMAVLPQGSPSTEAPAVSSVTSPTADLEVRRLTALPDHIQIYDVAISPDGSLLAFTDGRGVFVQPIDGGAEQRLFHGGTFHSVGFMPDGQRILASGGKGDEIATWLVPIDGSAPEQLLDYTGAHVRLSPDGTRVAVSHSEGVRVVELATGRTTQLFEPEAAPRHVAELIWSPDSRAIAIGHPGTTEKSAIEVIDLGTGAHRIALRARGLSSYGMMALAWLPDDRLLFTIHRGDHSTLHQIVGASTAEGAAPGPELHRWDQLGITRIRTDRDGDRLIYTAGKTQRRVDLLSTEGGPTRRLTDADWIEHPAGWESDDIVVFASEQGGGAVFRQHLGTGVRTMIPGTERTEVGRSAKLAGYNQVDDGWVGMLVERAAGDDRREMTVIHRSAAGEERIVTQLTMQHTPLLSKNEGMLCRRDRCVAGFLLEGGVLELRAWLLDGTIAGAPVRIEGVSERFRWSLSDDATRVAVVTAGPPELLIVDLATGRRTSRESPVDWPQAVAFDPDGETLYVSGLVESGDDPYQLVALHPDNQVDHLWEAQSYLVGEVHPSPSGTQLALGLIVFQDAVWLLEGLVP